MDQLFFIVRNGAHCCDFPLTELIRFTLFAHDTTASESMVSDLPGCCAFYAFPDVKKISLMKANSPVSVCFNFEAPRWVESAVQHVVHAAETRICMSAPFLSLSSISSTNATSMSNTSSIQSSILGHRCYTDCLHMEDVKDVKNKLICVTFQPLTGQHVNKRLESENVGVVQKSMDSINKDTNLATEVIITIRSPAMTTIEWTCLAW